MIIKKTEWINSKVVLRIIFYNLHKSPPKEKQNRLAFVSQNLFSLFIKHCKIINLWLRNWFRLQAIESKFILRVIGVVAAARLFLPVVVYIDRLHDQPLHYLEVLKSNKNDFRAGLLDPLPYNSQVNWSRTRKLTNYLSDSKIYKTRFA